MDVNALRQDIPTDGKMGDSILRLLPLEQRQRHPDLWYEDGNVVLVTPSTIFCVYHGMLAKHSPLFQTEKVMPKDNLNKGFEGKPVVNMHDDPEDLAHFLTAIYDFGNLV